MVSGLLGSSPVECELSRPRSENVPARVKDILQYFLRCPGAADTIEGLVRWRLLEETIHRSVEEVNQALSWLVDEGFLLQESAVGSDPIFRLNAEREIEARNLVTKVLNCR